MEDPSGNYRAVLWVRHCFGCHNKFKWKLTDISSYAKVFPSFGNYETDSRKQAYKLPSYCTAELGEIQSLIFGYRLKNILTEIFESINKFSEKDIILKEFEKITLYSSVLPRAMETAKLISKETINSELSNETDKINRINFIQEKIEQADDKVNSTTLKESNEAVDILNTEFNEDLGYCLISKNCPIAATPETTEFKTQNKEEIKKNYNKFKEEVLQNLSGNTLNLIVSHSSFLQKSLHFEKDRKMENLDAYFIIYKKNTSGEWKEMPELRRLYLFAENKIIEPNTDNVLIPPLRDKREALTQKNNELIKDFGLGLLPDYLDDSNFKKSIYKTKLLKRSVGNCNKPPTDDVVREENLKSKIKSLNIAMGEPPMQGLVGLDTSRAARAPWRPGRRAEEEATVELGGGKRRKTRKIRKTKKNKISKKKRSKKKKSKKKKSKRKNKKSKRKNLRATKKE